MSFRIEKPRRTNIQWKWDLSTRKMIIGKPRYLEVQVLIQNPAGPWSWLLNLLIRQKLVRFTRYCSKALFWWYKRLFCIRTTVRRKTTSNMSCWEHWSLYRKLALPRWHKSKSVIKRCRLKPESMQEKIYPENWIN